MIKKLILFFALIFLTGCSFITQRGTNIETPEIGISPIYGRWTITKFIYNKNSEQDNFKFKDIIGEEILFSNDSAVLANDYIKDVKYKTKYVKLSDYLYKKFNIDYKELGIEDSGVYSTYVMDKDSKDKSYYEIIKVGKDRALLFDNGIILEIELLDDKIENENLNEYILAKKDEVLTRGNLFDQSGDKGFLIAFKTKVDTNIPSWNYKTLYIKFSNLKLENVYELNNIILPRDNSFSEISVQRESKSNETTDKLIVKDYKNTSLKNSESEILKTETEELKFDNNIMTIDFITNNFVNIEKLNLDDNSRKLRIYRLKDLEEKKPLRYSEFLSKELISSQEEKIDLLKKDPSNIGIYRDNGFWKLKGRHSDGESVNDFDLNLVLPYEVNKYNRLNIPMPDIRNFNSNVKDGFVSPDNNFLITLENNMIKIYNIKGGSIEPQTIFEREIGNDATTIMTEWATGKYANDWQEVLSTNK